MSEQETAEFTQASANEHDAKLRAGAEAILLRDKHVSVASLKDLAGSEPVAQLFIDDMIADKLVSPVNANEILYPMTDDAPARMKAALLVKYDPSETFESALARLRNNPDYRAHFLGHLVLETSEEIKPEVAEATTVENPNSLVWAGAPMTEEATADKPEIDETVASEEPATTPPAAEPIAPPPEADAAAEDTGVAPPEEAEPPVVPADTDELAVFGRESETLDLPSTVKTHEKMLASIEWMIEERKRKEEGWTYKHSPVHKKLSYLEVPGSDQRLVRAFEFEPNKLILKTPRSSDAWQSHFEDGLATAIRHFDDPRGITIKNVDQAFIEKTVKAMNAQLLKEGRGFTNSKNEVLTQVIINGATISLLPEPSSALDEAASSEPVPTRPLNAANGNGSVVGAANVA